MSIEKGNTEPYHVPKLDKAARLGSITRVEKDIDEIAKISRGIGEGVTRLAFSNEETRAMNWTMKRLRESGFQCKFPIHFTSPLSLMRYC